MTGAWYEKVKVPEFCPPTLRIIGKFLPSPAGTIHLHDVWEYEFGTIGHNFPPIVIWPDKPNDVPDNVKILPPIVGPVEGVACVTTGGK